MIVADSDVLIDALRGTEPSRSRVATELRVGSLATTVITVFELESGARSEADRDKVATLLSAMIVFDLDRDAATTAGEVRRTLEAQGTKIGMADYLIAGICIARGATLWTRNRSHFDRVARLTCV